MENNYIFLNKLPIFFILWYVTIIYFYKLVNNLIYLFVFKNLIILLLFLNQSFLIIDDLSIIKYDINFNLLL